MKKLLTLVSFIPLLFVNTASAQIAGDTAVCAGEKVTYYAPYVSGASYFWSITGGTILGSPVTDSAVVQWGAAGTGTLIVSQTSPSANYFLNITIYPKPAPEITHAPYPSCPTAGGQGSTGQLPDHKSDCEKVCKYATVTYSTTLNAGSTYQWFATGDLSITTSTNTATVTWGSTGYGTLLVIETNQWGCTDSAEICVEKIDLPVANFTHQSSACKFSSVPFTNLSTGANTYQWYFGDGGTSSLTNPTHSYSSAGTYTITLIVFNKCFCSDTFSSIITIDSLPGPEITCPSTVCAFDTATYSTAATAGCTYNWFAIGGTIISGAGTPSVTVAWGAGQLGTLGLYITGCGGVCSDTTLIYIPIVPSIATISGDTVVCPGDCKTYTLPLFSGATYTWSLSSSNCGVLSDSVCCNEVEICWAPNMMVCNDTLTVQFYDSFLQCGGTASIVIRVRPELTIMGPNPACSNTVSNYFALMGLPCFWNVYPAGPILSGSPSPSVSVNWQGLTGNFLITAVPLNPLNTCSDSAVLAVKVHAPPAAPSITGDTVVCPNSSAMYCANPTSNTVNWIITGGTPTSSIGSCVTVTWGSTPPFIVQAFTQMPNSPFCNSDTTTQNVYPVTPAPPAIVAGSPFCANSTNSFSCPTLYPVGTTYTWSITPSNAGSVLSLGSASTLIEWGNNAPQTVTVTLTVNVCGNNLSNSTTVTLNPAPTPTVAQLGSLCAGGSAQLQATGGVSYMWSGPSGYNSVTNPTTIFLEGLYQVTATNASGCTALSQINVQYVSGPTASISTLNFLTYCIGTAYSVNMCALGNVNYTYLWSNGATTQCASVSTPGSYTVVVTDVTNGCTALSNALVVQEDSCNGGSGGPGSCTPNGSVSFTHTSCNPVAFTNTSVNAFNFSWNFGDFNFSNLTNPTHSYSQAGFYLVVLSGLVPSTNGVDTCVLQDTAHIEIPLLAKFDVASGCWNDSVCFTDKSTYTAGNNITSWSWNFGDANTSSLPNPCHLYAAPGTYIVTLTVSNGLCTDVFTDTVIVPAKPTAAFSFSSPNCINNPVLFTDASFASINYWNWNFGDAGTSLNQNPTHSFNPANTYTVTLIVHDIYGCYDTTQQNITIVAPALSGNITAFPDTVVCAGTNVLLVAPPCGICSYLWSNGSTNDSITVTSTGIYSVTMNDGSGCPYSTFIKIIVNTAPPAVITNTGNDELCFGEFTNLTTPYHINWLYQWMSNDPNVNGATSNAVSVFGLPPGTYNYQVVITDTTTGCFDTSLPYIVIVHPLPLPPVIVALGSSTVCAGDTVVLVVSHPDPTVIFQWNTGEVNDTIFVTKNGCYYATAIDTNGCKNTASYCVTVNPLPYLCSFYEGCFDTCAPYTICAPAGSSWQWLNNGVPIPSATNQCYTTSMSGIYSVIVTNSFGCVDTTGELDLTLYPCPDSLCADLRIDSVVCDSTGKYVLHYQVFNQSQVTVTQVNLEVLPPHLNIAFSPVINFITIPSGGSSGPLTATIFNGTAGDTLCFRSHIAAFDSMGHELICCYSDTECVVLPPCHEVDTTCCYFYYLKDSVWCVQTPVGLQYHFNMTIRGCGTLQMQTSGNTTINGSNPVVMNGNTLVISGTYTPTGPADTIMCITFMMNQGNVFCSDTTICINLHCGTPAHPSCLLEFDKNICVGQTSTFTYGGNPSGLTFTWQFPNGVPATASGPGPHTVTYNTAGCHPVILIINNLLPGTIDCVDSICVHAPPVATVQQVGNSLFAYPAGMSYQWYSVNPNWTIMSGQTNQFLNPTFSTLFCVVVTDQYGCKDTACIDHQTGIEELSYSDWSIYPNPNDGAFALKLNSAKPENVELKVTDMVGNVIDLRVFETHSGENHFYIANKNFAAGVYFIQLKTEKGVGLRRMVVR